MNLLFVKSNKLGSKIIRWGLGEGASHVIVEFDGSYFHAYGKMVQEIHLNDFYEIGYEVVHIIQLPLDKKEISAKHSFIKYADNHLYDYPAFVYFAWRASLRKFFGIPFPETNAWAVSDMNLCTELIYMAAEVYAEMTGKQIIPSDIDLAMVGPEEAYYRIFEHIKRYNL